MSENRDLKRIERRAFAHFLQDGLAETVFGLFLVVLGSFMSLTGGVLIALALFMLAAHLARKVRKRFVYPRTGYAELRPGEPRRLIQAVAAFAAIAFVGTGVLIVTGHGSVAGNWYRWLPIFYGLFVSGAFVGLALASGIPRYWMYALASFAAGVAWTVPVFEGRMTGMSLFLLSMGVFLLSCGVIVFILFLRRHPIRAEEASYDAE